MNGVLNAKSSSARKSPVQKRSRERVEKMLAVATDLIAEYGSDSLRMSDIAARAGVSIGSLYQFFPDKTAIIGALVERSNEQGRQCIVEGLAQVRDAASMRRAFSDLIDLYYRTFLDEPVMRDIWFGAQADRNLREAQLGDSRKNGALVAAVLKRLRPQADAAALETSALAVMHLGEEAIRLAMSVERKEGDALIDAYKRMALSELLRE
jgi:AcrR family transcriptional regulator